MIEGWIAWIIIGLIAGFIASKIVNKGGSGVVVDIILGLIGSIVGGWLFTAFNFAPAGGWIYSIFVSVIGAIIVLVIYHAIVGRRATY